MRAAICMFALLGFCGLIVGCDADSANDNSTTITPAEAKALADKMPKPSDVIKNEKKKK